MLHNFAVAQLVPMHVLDLVVLTDRRNAEEYAALHRNAAHTAMCSGVLDAYYDGVAHRDDIKNIQPVVGEGLVYVREDSAYAIAADCPSMITRILGKVGQS
jgi:hypothetical protein